MFCAEKAAHEMHMPAVLVCSRMSGSVGKSYNFISSSCDNIGFFGLG